VVQLVGLQTPDTPVFGPLMIANTTAVLPIGEFDEATRAVTVWLVFTGLVAVGGVKVMLPGGNQVLPAVAK
jgi:hypothetical protein